ncbi:uncharacterized protein [Lepeophtheirus salmonis]|uniref:uncharacterized protein isoform X2 n=1 Tax=Lepeophtheirus salmonis TaxID=72036 RepID=UPI001AE53AC2|nr:zinc finger and BTB domain-containing protein 17-like isoform X2 [Lepeophtheirus salmonis]
MDEEDQLLLKWDDHHKSFFSLASELMDREELIDVTLITGDSSFPAHKLILSICSPYFRSLFVRNPCSHPMVVLKDVEAKYLRLLLIYMYEGQVACPSAELSGLLATAKSLQIRGLLELEKKRRRATSSSDDHSSSSASGTLHPLHTHNNNNNILVEEETLMKNEQSSPLDMHVDERASPSLQTYVKPNQDSSLMNNNSHNTHGGSHAPSNGLNYTTKGASSGQPPSSNMLPPNALDPSDPMASMNALLAAAASQVQQNHQIKGGDKSNSKLDPNNSTSASNEINQAAAMANLQLYYYMQKVAGIGNGGPPSSTPSSSSPKERKECHVCGKTLYDRSTWNRHMRIHTGEKPYPCRFCGRRFRTNYNKLGHEKKCPDRHNGEGTDGGGREKGLAPSANKNTNNTSSSNNNNTSVTIS